MWKDVKSGVKLTVSVVAYGLMVDTALRLHGFISRKFLLDSWQRIAKQQRSEKADAETKRKHQADFDLNLRFWEMPDKGWKKKKMTRWTSVRNDEANFNI